MNKENVMSNAQSWELEVVCKNRKYLNKVVKAILKYGNIDFEVNQVEGKPNHDGIWEGRYTVLMWSCWFNNLHILTKDLKNIEDKLN